MAGRSGVIVFSLALGAMFSILLASSISSEHSRPHHATIPTEPNVSQLDVIEIVERDLQSKLPQTQETKLVYHYYNFSSHQYQSDAEYVRYIIDNIGYGYNFDVIKGNPELLQLPLRFVHFNGTVYNVDPSADSVEKICELPSLLCPMGRFGEFARDRLVFNAEIRWEPATEEMWYNEGFYIIDAETGEIVWNSIDFELNRKPMPSINFDNRTIRQIFEEKLNPEGYAGAYMEYSAHIQGNNIGYWPKHVRGTLGIDNKVLWKNIDIVAHTVISDSDYSNDHTGRFASSVIDPNETYEYTFIEVGQYRYHCDIHPWMTGTVQVLKGFS